MRIYKCIILIGATLLLMNSIVWASTPKNVRVTNVTQSQWTISWITDVDEIGYIMWGTNTDSLSERGLDDRDSGTPTIKDDIHHITIAPGTLQATTTYYYQIISGTHISNVASITTGVDKIPPSSDPVYGYVYKWVPQLSATGTILYLNLESSSGTSAPRSILIIDAEGGWVESPGNFRLPDLSDFFNYSTNTDLCIYVEGAKDGTASLRRKISESIPAPDIIIPDTTPPEIPIVTDEGTYAGSSTCLHAKWINTDAQSGIKEYEYAIGTTRGGTDVINWTSVGTKTEVTQTNLPLVINKIYYFSVRAKNRADLWSIGVSDGIKIGYSSHLVSKIPVYPNPFLSSKKHHTITFGGVNEDRLTKEVTIKIFTIAGELVHKIEQTDCNGRIEWTPPANLASGIYIYLITNPLGEKVIGKLGIIK